MWETESRPLRKARWRRLLTRGLVAWLVLLPILLSSAAEANERKLKVGDRVEVEHLGRSKPGTITGFAGGRIWVEMDGVTLPLLPTQVRFLPEPPKERTWRDSSGTFKIQATLIAENASSVSLRKSDGETITVPIDKLSKRDQDYVVEHRSPASCPGEEGDVSEYNALPMADLSAMETIALADPTAPWSYAPPPIPTFAPNPRLPVDIPSHKIHMHDAPILVMSCDGSAAALRVTNSSDKKTVLHVVDFTNGQLLASKEMASTKFFPKDVTPGARFVITASGRNVHPQYVAFWKPSNGSLERVGGWRVPNTSTEGFANVRFIGLERILTIDTTGRLILWKPGGGKALATCVIDRNRKHGYSLDGRRMACFLDGHIHLLDLAIGRGLAALEPEGNPPDVLALSASGRRLAGLSGKHLVVWDLETGKVLQRVKLQNTQTSSVDWLDERYVLVGQDKVVDTQSGIGFWALTRSGVDAVCIAPAGKVVYFAQEFGESRLFSCSLPVETIAQRWEEFDKNTLVKLEPGPISLHTEELEFSDAECQQIRDSLTKQLEANGFTIESGASMKITMQMKLGKAEQVEVRTIINEKVAVVTCRASTSRMTFTIGDRVIWKKFNHRRIPVGETIVPKDDESCQQATDRMYGPRTSFFGEARLPEPGLLLPDAMSCLGGWRLTKTGLQ